MASGSAAAPAIPGDAVDSDSPLSCPTPSRCPYCAADATRHWIRWGSYERYAGDPDDSSRRIAVPRYQCKFTGRTFSLLPDELLPYCSLRTPVVLSSLRALLLEVDDTSPVALSTFARTSSVPRGTLRRLRSRYLRAAPLLPLPTREGVLGGGAFLNALLQRSAPALLILFRTWKEREPKHSIVGIYAR